MHTYLYTAETAKWYGLLAKAQAQSKRYLDSETERYVADMLFRFGTDADSILFQPEMGSSVEWNVEKHDRMMRLQSAGERCLVTAGFFPEHANYAGLPLSHFIEKGRQAYRDLTIAMPKVRVYAHVCEHFVGLVEVLQKVGELSGVCHSIDLLQACELWQQEGSHHSWRMIQANTNAFPASTMSSATH